jgi:prepilin-type N-terminal cleavage/methylation domain-containing protein
MMAEGLAGMGEGAMMQRGFTLIEIMITVAILAILGSLALSAYEGYITEARYGTAQKDIAQIQLILDDLASDNDLAGLEPSGYTAGTELGVYTASADGSVVLGSLSSTPSGAAQWLDPWGRSYRYSRADLAEPDYVLYSQGPDASSSADDQYKH